MIIMKNKQHIYMKRIILFLFAILLTCCLFSQKSNVFYSAYGSEKNSDKRKVAMMFKSHSLNLGVNLDMESSRSAYLKNYKVLLGYGKHNIESISFVPHFILGYRRLGDEYSDKSLIKGFKYNNYYCGAGLALYRNMGRFNFGFNADFLIFKHKLEFKEDVLRNGEEFDFNIAVYAGYDLSKHLIIFAEAKYNYYSFMLMNDKLKNYHFTGLGIAFKM